MALGDARSSNSKSNANSGKVFDQTYYSRIRIKNKDKLAVGFTYSKGLLKVEISEEQEGYRYEPIASITLSPNKAKLLANELEQFINKMKSGEEIDPKSGVGVNTGMGDVVSFIAFKTTGKRPDVPEHSFVVGKVDTTGAIQNPVEFIFNVDYDYALHWTNVENMEVEREMYQFAGIETFLDVLKEFIMSSAGAIGASVWDTGRYDVARISRKMDPIYDKLGIEKKTSGSGTGNTENFFSRSSNGNGFGMNPPQSNSGRSTRKSFDEIEDMLD